MTQYKLLILFLLFLTKASFAQDTEGTTPAPSTDDKANDIVPIIYDFESSQPLKNLIPFDKMFAVKFLNIDSSVKSFIFKIYVINDESYSFGNYTKYSGKEIDFQSIMRLDSNRILQSDSLIRDIHFIGEQANIVFPFKLRPNRNYILEVKTYTKEELTQDQKKDLSEKLKRDLTLTQFLDTVATNYIRNPEYGFGGISTLLPHFNKLASKEILKVNPSFRLSSPIDSSQLRNMAVLFNNFTNSMLILKAQKFPPSNNDTLTDLNLNQENKKELERNLENINWGLIKKGDNDYNGFKPIFDFLITQSVDSQSTEDLKLDSTNFFKNIDKFIASREIVFNELIDNAIVNNVQINRGLSSTYPQDFVKQARMYITMDAGIAYVWKLDRANFYAGLNVYFRPIDKTIPLTNYRRFGDFMMTRTSFLIGFSLTSVYQENVRKGLLDDNKALILGIGFRVTPWLKFNGGSYLYYKFDHNPLISDSRYQFTGAPFVSMSIDIDVKPLFEGIGEAVFKQ